MKLIISLFLISLSLSFTVSPSSDSSLTAINYPFSVCGNGTWVMKNLTLSQPPGRNVDIQIVASGVANDYIEFKSVDLYLKLNGLFLHSETVAFVKTVDQGDLVEFVYHSFVPSFAPAGNYVMSFTYKDTQGKENGCWSFAFKF